MGNIYDLIKEHLEGLDKCSKCGLPTCDSKLQEFNGICESCYYGDEEEGEL